LTDARSAARAAAIDPERLPSLPAVAVEVVERFAAFAPRLAAVAVLPPPPKPVAVLPVLLRPVAAFAPRLAAVAVLPVLLLLPVAAFEPRPAAVAVEPLEDDVLEDVLPPP
jgi:hypothetical protein